jgi:hypothetical protein
MEGRKQSNSMHRVVLFQSSFGAKYVSDPAIMLRFTGVLDSTLSLPSLVELGNGMEDSRHILQFLVTFNEAHSLSALVYTKNNFGNQHGITIIWTSYSALTCRRE